MRSFVLSAEYVLCCCFASVVLLYAVTALLNYGEARKSGAASCHVNAVRATKAVNVLGAAALLLPVGIAGVWGDAIIGLIYGLIVINVAAFTMWNLFAITDTSMHIHLLTEIYRAQRISGPQLSSLYNKEVIIRARVPRLVELGQLRRTDGVLQLSGGTVLRGAQLCAVFRHVLGIPVRPPTSIDSR